MAYVVNYYYYAGSIRVAIRSGASTLKLQLDDHSLVLWDKLGSTSINVDSSGGFSSEIRYYQ